MIKLTDYFQGRAIIFSIIILALSAIQSYEANKLIKRINEENQNDYRKPSFVLAPYVEIILVVILLIICIFLPINPSVIDE